jgi:uroporphyrinogen III methyltransferase / synthase
VRAVVVTRDEGSDGPLSRELREMGLEVLSWPAVATAAGDTAALDAALEAVSSFDWIVFASRNAVAAVFKRLRQLPQGVAIAAVGRATALTLRERGWPVDLLPDESNAAALVAAFAARWSEAGAAGARVLYPASSRALPTIATGLRQLGARVTQVEAYSTEGARLDLPECRAWIAREGIAAVTFASPSAVSELARSLGDSDFARLLANARAVAIGRTTAHELERRGHAAVVAESPTLHGLALTTSRLLLLRP